MAINKRVFSIILTWQFNCALFIIISFTGLSQTSKINNSAICKRLSIQCAQLANQCYRYVQNSYFETNIARSKKQIDTAMYFINESILSMDSVILLTSNSDTFALKYAHTAKDYAIQAKKKINILENTTDNYQLKELSKQCIFIVQNVTIDAYHASLYFKHEKNKIKKTNKPEVKVPEKRVAKLDIDQTLFVLLQEDVKNKKEGNDQEIVKLSNELKTTKDAGTKSKINSQIDNLKKQQTELERKDQDARSKLTSINKQIDERDKNPSAIEVKEETVFSKSIKPTDEWAKQVKLDVDMPADLVYQVQLGVYKNELVPGVFKGLNPIYGKTTDKGICYSTGLFEKYIDAKEAKAYVFSMGLKDAFIIAYYNKKRITLAEAAKIEK